LLTFTQELELLDDDAKVYKQIGPALVHQDHMEATSNVSKRLEFIGVEVKRIDEKLAVLEEKARKKQVTLEKLQEEAQRIQAGAAAS
jgi:prefoldin beta subunit